MSPRFPGRLIEISAPSTLRCRRGVPWAPLSADMFPEAPRNDAHNHVRVELGAPMVCHSRYKARVRRPGVPFPGS